ncbi:phage tail tape measure protein [Erwinia piriflorinigrans]|uniref:phage tail tape measure protein n=1 Tax=Erwinia piriflorinigrans TaxID=665097 RepID=UPI000AA4B9CD
MSHNNLRLQDIQKAVDQLTRSFRSTTDGSKALSVALGTIRASLEKANQNAVQLYKTFASGNGQAVKQLGLQKQASQAIDALQNSAQRLRQLADKTRQTPVSQHSLPVSQNLLPVSQHSLPAPEAQQARLRAARDTHAARLEVRDRIAAFGAGSKAAGMSLGTPILSAIKQDASMESAMKGVTNEVSGLLDKSGQPTARYDDLLAAIKNASERQPVENGAAGYAALVAEAARNQQANPQDNWEDQKRALLAAASKQAQQKASGQGGLAGEWMMVQTSMDNLSGSLGATLHQPLMEILENVRKVTVAMRQWVEQNPQLAGTLMKLAAGGAALAVALGTLAGAAAAVLGPLAAMRLGLSTIGVKGLPSLTAAVGSTGKALGWLANAPLTLLRNALAATSGYKGLLDSPKNALSRTAGVMGDALKAVGGPLMAMLRARRPPADGDAARRVFQHQGVDCRDEKPDGDMACGDVRYKNGDRHGVKSDGDAARRDEHHRRSVEYADFRAISPVAPRAVRYFGRAGLSVKSGRAAGGCAGWGGAADMELLGADQSLPRRRGGRIQRGSRAHQRGACPAPADIRRHRQRGKRGMELVYRAAHSG